MPGTTGGPFAEHNVVDLEDRMGQLRFGLYVRGFADIVPVSLADAHSGALRVKSFPDQRTDAISCPTVSKEKKVRKPPIHRIKERVRSPKLTNNDTGFVLLPSRPSASSTRSCSTRLFVASA